MNKYNYDFNPNTCNSNYFKELNKLMKKINPNKQQFKRLTKKKLASYNVGKCTYPLLKNCEPDEYFFDNKRQILLGRFLDTAACFFNCSKNYFTLAVDPFSLFKNDLFIRYVLDYPELFINKGSTELEDVFPIRILLSTKHFIPSYLDKKMTRTEEFTSELLEPPKINKFRASMEPSILEKFYTLPSNNILKQRITDNAPISHVVSRELCILYEMKLFFYVVEENDGNYSPFILVSKYNMRDIKKKYASYNKQMPNLKLYYHKKNKPLTRKIINHA